MSVFLLIFHLNLFKIYFKGLSVAVDVGDKRPEKGVLDVEFEE